MSFRRRALVSLAACPLSAAFTAIVLGLREPDIAAGEAVFRMAVSGSLGVAAAWLILGVLDAPPR